MQSKLIAGDDNLSNIKSRRQTKEVWRDMNIKVEGCVSLRLKY